MTSHLNEIVHGIGCGRRQPISKSDRSDASRATHRAIGCVNQRLCIAYDINGNNAYLVVQIVMVDKILVNHQLQQ